MTRKRAAAAVKRGFTWGILGLCRENNSCSRRLQFYDVDNLPMQRKRVARHLWATETSEVQMLAASPLIDRQNGWFPAFAGMTE